MDEPTEDPPDRSLPTSSFTKEQILEGLHVSRDRNKELEKENADLRAALAVQTEKTNTMEKILEELRATVALLTKQSTEESRSPKTKRKRKKTSPVQNSAQAIPTSNHYQALSDKEMESDSSSATVVSDKMSIKQTFPPLPSPTISSIKSMPRSQKSVLINSSSSSKNTITQQDNFPANPSTSKTQTPTQNTQHKTSNLPTPVESKIPPIVLRDPSKWNQLRSHLSQNHINFLKARNTQSGITIEPSTSSDHRAITRFLELNQLPYHTYQLPDQKLLRVVIRNVPTMFTLEDIREDLHLQGFTPQDVHRMHKPKNPSSNEQPAPIPMILVILDRTQDKIFHLTQILGLAVQVEAQHPRATIGQCYRCQLYGHSQSNCRAAPRCVKCGRDHFTHECTKGRDSPATCALCGGAHPANYRGCSKAPVIRSTRSYANATKPTPSPPTTTQVTSTPSADQNIAALIASFQESYKQMSQIASMLFPHFPKATQ